MATSNADRLELVSQAIDDIITGGTSSYQVEGRAATSIDLAALYKIEDMLKRRIARSQVGIFGVVEFRRPR